MDATLNWLWQGAIVAIASFAMLRALARAGANVRYLVCWAAALLVVALPVLSRLHAAAMPVAAVPPLESVTMVSLPDAWWTSSLVMLAAWMIWIVVHSVRFATAIVALRRARARSQAFPADVAAALPQWGRLRGEGRRATLVVSDSVTTAAVLGWGRPLIAVAPSAVRLLRTDELDRILIHEWAHVQRRDDLVNIVQIVIRAMAGWHPALWWLDRRLHIEREIACDEMTVAIAGSPKSYAESLLKLATLRGRSRALEAAPAALTSSCLRARIIRIVSSSTSIAPIWSRSIAAAIVMLLSVTSLGVAGLTPVATALATPLVPRIPSRQSTVLRPAALPISSSNGAGRQSAAGRPADQPSPARPSTPERSVPAPPPATASVPPPTAQAAGTIERTGTTGGVATDADREIAAPLPGAPLTAAGQPAVTPSPSPWAAMAAGGTTIGRKSKDAGLATAGLFTRFARHVAGSF
jgi:bla regulator protein blaR1